MQAERYIAATDAGTSKISLCVAKVEGDDIQVIYYKEAPSDGIRYSCVFNPTRAATPLKQLICEAESELNIKIMQTLIGLPRYSIVQDNKSACVDRTNPETCISKEEIRSLKNSAMENFPLSEPGKLEIYGVVAESFSADELICASENDVIGVPANKIEGHFKGFIGASKPVINLDMMLNQVGVAPAQKMFTPSAVARAVLTDTEKDNGVALVEMGAGVTSVTIYKGGRLRHFSSIPFGAKCITSDIMFECSFSETLAENIKFGYGACLPDRLQTMSDKVLRINDEETGTYEQLPVKYLSEIITARAREIIEAILYQIQESGYADGLRSGVVLTGGGANLANLSTMFKEMSGYNVRTGFPRTQNFSSGGCPGVVETSAAAVIGMILEAKSDPYVNCIQEIETQPVRTETDKNSDTDEGGSGSSNGLFGPDDFDHSEVLTPKDNERNKKIDSRRKTRDEKKLTWRTRKKLEGVWDTVEDLFSKYDE